VGGKAGTRPIDRNTLIKKMKFKELKTKHTTPDED
jgi:hypothetical protein